MARRSRTTDTGNDPDRSQPAEENGTVLIDLALQGGGSHGAFTWGVLDALLEDGRVRFEGASGTSAGAMNAVVMAHALARARANGQRGQAVNEAARAALPAPRRCLRSRLRRRAAPCTS